MTMIAAQREPVSEADRLELALARASVGQLADAIPGYFDGDDIEELIGLLKAELNQPA